MITAGSRTGAASPFSGHSRALAQPRVRLARFLVVGHDALVEIRPYRSRTRRVSARSRRGS